MGCDPRIKKKQQSQIVFSNGSLLSNISIELPNYPLSIHLPTHPPIHLPFPPFSSSSTHPSLHLSIDLSIDPSIYPSSIHQSIIHLCHSVNAYIYAFLFLSIDSPIHYPFIQPSTCLIIHSSMHLSLLPSSIHYPLTRPSIHLLIPPSTHPSNHSSTHSATHHSSIYLSIILLPYPQSTYPPSTNFFIHLNFHPFPIYPRIYPSSIHHPLPVTTMPSIHLSIYSIIHPSNHPFISLSAQSDIIHPSIIHHSSIHDSYRHTLSPIHPFFSLLSNWVPDTVQGRLIIVL